MSKKFIFAQYGICLCFMVFPFVFVIANLLAITQDAFAQIFPNPSLACVHVNCFFLLAPYTFQQLLLLVTYGILSFVYIVLLAYFISNTNHKERTHLVMIGLAFYSVYIQITRIVLSFAIFKYNFYWWIPLISQIAFFAQTLHVGLFFTHSLLLITKDNTRVWMWITCAFFISFLITYLVPFDHHILTERLIHEMGYTIQFQIFVVVLYIITFINYAIYYMKTRRVTALLLQIGYACNAFAMYMLFIASRGRILVVIAIVAFTFSIISLSRYSMLISRERI